MLRAVVVVAAIVVVVVIARFRPALRPAPLVISGNLDGPGVFVFTSESCDSCDEARSVYREVLGAEGFVEYSWEAEPALLTRLGVEEIPVGTVIDRSGNEVASFRHIPNRRALARAARRVRSAP